MFFISLEKLLHSQGGTPYLNDFVMIESDNRVNPIREGNDKHP